MELYFIVKTLHILSATVLFGTGMGIAFFMFRSYFTQDLNEKLYAARNTVLADYIFTFPAAVIQPLTGVWLISIMDLNWMDFWLQVTYLVYIVAAFCWIPVVWIQIQLKAILQHCIEHNESLPERYNHLFKIWFWLGWPAFLGLILVFFMMVMKPQ